MVPRFQVAVILAAFAILIASSQSAAEDQRSQIRSALFVSNPLPPLDLQTYGEFEPMQGVVAERVSYATDYGLRVPAIVYRPKQRPAGKMPGIVVVNGHGGDKYSWYALYTGMLYAQAGAAVLTYDPIGEGERNAQRKNGTRQHDRDIGPPEMARRMSGLMITDVMQRSRTWRSVPTPIRTGWRHWDTRWAPSFSESRARWTRA
jgi:hypothetical protein